MAKLHGGTHHVQGKLNRGGPKPRIYANHGGTNHQMGKTHDVPTLPQVNDQNYAGHRVGVGKRKK
jgi:hypothetical protein